MDSRYSSNYDPFFPSQSSVTDSEYEFHHGPFFSPQPSPIDPTYTPYYEHAVSPQSSVMDSTHTPYYDESIQESQAYTGFMNYSNSFNAIQMARSLSESTAYTSSSDDNACLLQNGYSGYEVYPAFEAPPQSSLLGAQPTHQPLKPIWRTLFDQYIGHMDTCAYNITKTAEAFLDSQDGLQIKETFEEGGDLPFSFITSQAIAKKVRKSGRRDMERERRAVEEILFDALLKFFANSSHLQSYLEQMLLEAAYQQLLRLDGDSFEICQVSITMVLKGVEDELQYPGSREKQRAELATQRSGRSNRSTSEKEKEKYICDYPACQGKSFSRPADLERHKVSVHLEEDRRESFFCDYKLCARKDVPFYRQDHFRDHLRDQHKEDLPRRGSKNDQGWWDSRNNHAMNDGWWRCNKCMVRVVTEDYGFICPACSNACESDRQRHRIPTE